MSFFLNYFFWSALKCALRRSSAERTLSIAEDHNKFFSWRSVRSSRRLRVQPQAWCRTVTLNSNRGAQSGSEENYFLLIVISTTMAIHRFFFLFLFFFPKGKNVTVSFTFTKARCKMVYRSEPTLLWSQHNLRERLPFFFALLLCDTDCFSSETHLDFAERWSVCEVNESPSFHKPHTHTHTHTHTPLTQQFRSHISERCKGFLLSASCEGSQLLTISPPLWTQVYLRAHTLVVRARNPLNKACTDDNKHVSLLSSQNNLFAVQIRSLVIVMGAKFGVQWEKKCFVAGLIWK